MLGLIKMIFVNRLFGYLSVLIVVKWHTSSQAEAGLTATISRPHEQRMPEQAFGDIQEQFPTFHLEDKVAVEGGSISEPFASDLKGWVLEFIETRKDVWHA